MSLENELSRMEDLRGKLGSLRAEKHDLTVKIQETQIEYDRAKGAVERYNASPQPQVTDHALIRYMERVCEINFENIRKTILNPEVETAIRFSKTGRFKSNGLTYVYENYSIVTIYAD